LTKNSCASGSRYLIFLLPLGVPPRLSPSPLRLSSLPSFTLAIHLFTLLLAPVLAFTVRLFPLSPSFLPSYPPFLLFCLPPFLPPSLPFQDRCDPYKDATLPEAPAELVNELSRRYIMLYELITGERVFQATSLFRCHHACLRSLALEPAILDVLRHFYQVSPFLIHMYTSIIPLFFKS